MQALAGRVIAEMERRGLTLAVAESCTGGLIGHLLTDVPGSSKVFPGGVVAYANRPKRDLLGVPAEVLRERGAVSAEAAAAMAEGVRRALGTEVGVGVTGVAGPSGGSPEKPVGTVFIACAAPSGTAVERFQWTPEPDDAEDGPGSALREHNKHKSALAALELVLRQIEG
jgi:PncC family amidohydrolase